MFTKPLFINIGDSSGDGHGKEETFFFFSNFTKEEVWNAYRSGVEILGFDVCNTVALAETATLTKEQHDNIFHHQKFLNFCEINKNEYTIVDGMFLEETLDLEKRNYFLEKLSFLHIFLFTVWLGSEALFVFSQLEKSAENTVDIGGYAYFS